MNVTITFPFSQLTKIFRGRQSGAPYRRELLTRTAQFEARKAADAGDIYSRDAAKVAIDTFAFLAPGLLALQTKGDWL